MREHMDKPRLYERLGIDRDAAIALDSSLAMLANCSGPGADIRISKSLKWVCRQQVLLAYYLLEDTEQVRQQAAMLVAEVEDFLFGDWVDSYEVTRWVKDSSRPEGGYRNQFLAGREWSRREFRWMAMFRDGFLWALWLDDQAAARQIAGYAGDDAREQEVDFGPTDKAWRMVAAFLFLERPRSDWSPYESVIERARAKKPRLLLEALRAISSGDADAFRKAISECVRHHVRTEFEADQNGLDDKLALDASLVYQIAKQMGLSIDLPPKIRDYIIDGDLC